MNISIKSKSQCCGCGACKSVCGTHAITMVEDGMGFKYPVVNPDKCTDCGLCLKKCDFIPEYSKIDNFEEPLAFGARHKDNEELMTSRSGGVFAALADKCIKDGGVVYGAGFKGHFRVCHKRATTVNETKEFKGSKYVQSDTEDIFDAVKADLKNGLKVLFSGTPCQVANVKAFVGPKLRENLFLVDIICHGVPSPKFWKDYLNYLEAKENRKVSNVNFRNKEKYGWTSHKESFKYEGCYTYTYTYTYTFYKHYTFRDSCYECPFCNTHRPSDLTLGDFWGWEKTNPTFNLDDKGCSLILCNTPKGLKVFKETWENLHVITAALEDCMQIHLKKPTKRPELREKFENDYNNKGFDYIIKQYCRETFFERLRKHLGVAKRKAIQRYRIFKYK
ncbi:MAG: Coenzyme F420 hydrogenase/dehydrogenase, beta subunit C-terminal domain [Bacteroidales bacterium]|nr:Coenzyme F420 hydrogenase/dehydrogenase, beta subunit C-terminal domain [Bacteroidales bacterium]